MNNPPVILAVDDDKDFLELLRAKLEAKGFAVKTAKNGNEAVALAQASNPDLILMDIQMPEKDGIEATSDLQQNPKTKGIKIIFLTNLGDASPAVSTINKRFSQQIGAVDYFKKGGDLEVLIAKVRELI